MSQIPQPPVSQPTGIPSQTNAPGAVASLVLGIVGLFCFGIVLGILAIIYSGKARKAIAANPGVYTGGGMATAGLILGIIDVVGWAIAIIVNVANLS